MAGPKGVWWNDASFAAEVNSAEERLSPHSREENTTGEQAGATTAKMATEEGLGHSDVHNENVQNVTYLPAREETWDRFTSGAILAPNAELKQPSRPCTPPNLVRTLQVRHSLLLLGDLLTLAALAPLVYVVCAFVSLVPAQKLSFGCSAFSGESLCCGVRCLPISKGSRANDAAACRVCGLVGPTRHPIRCSCQGTMGYQKCKTNPRFCRALSLFFGCSL